jgi:hypothetical protein
VVENVQELGEPIEMIGHFAGGRVSPCRFRWKGRVYRVARVSSTWESRRGGIMNHHFVVRTSAGDVYEISFNTHTLGWTVDYAYSPGA